MAAPPERKFRTICRVTTFGYALTPSSVTPWSAARMKMALLVQSGRSCSRMATSLVAISSNRPRLPTGLVRLFSLAPARSRHSALSEGTQAAASRKKAKWDFSSSVDSFIPDPQWKLQCADVPSAPSDSEPLLADTPNASHRSAPSDAYQ